MLEAIAVTKDYPARSKGRTSYFQAVRPASIRLEDGGSYALVGESGSGKSTLCDGFIRRLPRGYQTVYGRDGVYLSGGEQQRAAIARAIVKNAPILDEATASLDPENKGLIQRAVSRLIHGKTVLVIAHRLRTVVGADKILVLDGGRVTAEGPHEELMRKNGLYRRLYDLQQTSMAWGV